MPSLRISDCISLLSLCFCLLINAAIAGTIHGTIQLPESPQKLAPLNSTLITLNDGEYRTYTTTSSNSFTFQNIPPGVHLLTVHCHTYHFSQIKIQISNDGNDGNDGNAGDDDDDDDVPKCIEYVYPGAPKRPIPYPLTLVAHAEYQYFEPRPSFSLFFIFKNPMVLMGLFSVGMMVIMPHMMKNLDPEQKEQMKKQMEMQSDPQKMLNSLWGDISGKKEITEKKVVRKGGARMKRE